MQIRTFTQLDIITKYGDDLKLNFYRQDSNGNAINNSAYIYIIQIQTKAGGTVLKTYTTTGSVSGLWTLLANNYASELTADTKYYYEITEDSGTEQCLIEGTIIFESK